MTVVWFQLRLRGERAQVIYMKHVHFSQCGLGCRVISVWCRVGVFMLGMCVLVVSGWPGVLDMVCHGLAWMVVGAPGFFGYV